jgi:hypothetical protein
MDVPEITAGEMLARKLRIYLHGDKPWDAKMAFDVGKKMAVFKKLMRVGYNTLSDVQFLHELGGFSQQDIADAVHGNELFNNKDVLRETLATGKTV